MRYIKNIFQDFALIFIFCFGFVAIINAPKIITNQHISYIIERLLLEIVLVCILISAIPYLRNGTKVLFGRISKQYELKSYSILRVGIGITFVICGNIFVSFIVWLTYPFFEQWDWGNYQSPYNTIPPFLKYTIALPLVVFVEELIYRGVLRIIFERHINNKIIIAVISSVLFAIAHYHYGIGKIIFTFFSGMMLMALYYRTNSLIPPMIAHYLINTWAHENSWYDIVWS